MAVIRRVRSLKGVGILADRSAKDIWPDFRKVNLIYGFNGSGKSTLSRVIACLQKGLVSDGLPQDCEFEIELDDGGIYGAPKKLQGPEKRICVFNSDFVAESLQWDTGTAKSIFYLSQEQADLVSQLKQTEQTLSEKQAVAAGAAKTAKASAKNFSTYCTERAKAVHNARRLGTRKYEAPKLKADYGSAVFDETSILAPERLAALQEIVTRTAPQPPIDTILIDNDEIKLAIKQATEFADVSLGDVVLEELKQHPQMVPWVKEGHEYHEKNGLETCLLCQNALSETRKDQLAAALDDRLSLLICDMTSAKSKAATVRGSDALNPQSLPKANELDPSLRETYTEGVIAFEAAARVIRSFLDEAANALSKRLQQPTLPAAHTLPSPSVLEAATTEFATALTVLDRLIEKHNTAVANFASGQHEASITILNHFLAEGKQDYESAKDTAEKDAATEQQAMADLKATERKISELKEKVRAHGPAALKITKLVHDYLGHKELTVIAADRGYTLHRHGKLVKGQPSEGEKTAIALCYFLTTLEAEGRKLQDLIVLIDDPISSLDTRAMNYACALVLKKLEKAGQLFVLTHNQHCMNEFKKAWKPKVKHETNPTGRLLYMDVQLPEDSALRSAQVVEMSPLLREYDSEYHFLCHQLLIFEQAGNDHSPNLLLMPNAMRRVLEIFLAFKVPGTAPIKDKLENLAGQHPDKLDSVRLAAVERLAQVESHSDNLDDLVSHSPMIVEEVRQTCSALLELMTVADAQHTKAIRKQCKAA